MYCTAPWKFPKSVAWYMERSRRLVMGVHGARAEGRSPLMPQGDVEFTNSINSFTADTKKEADKKC